MSSPTVNAPSVRYPFNISEAHPQVQQAMRWVFNTLTDHAQAFMAVSGQISALQSASTSSSSASSAPVTENITEETIIEGSQVGSVDNQTGQTAYTLRQSDNGGLIILNDSAAIALTLVAVSIPFLTLVRNYGSGSTTITPQSGATINYGTTLGASSMPLASGAQTWLFFDGSSGWWG